MRRARRRWLLAPAAALLAGCGFQLRRAPSFGFRTLQLQSVQDSALLHELRQALGAAGVQVLSGAAPQLPAEVVLQVLTDQREKVVVGISAAGQVREFQLRVRLMFRLRTPDGREPIPDTELLQQRDISYSETAALAKEAEEALHYRTMQTDVVQQVLRRLAAVRGL